MTAQETEMTAKQRPNTTVESIVNLLEKKNLYIMYLFRFSSVHSVFISIISVKPFHCKRYSVLFYVYGKYFYVNNITHFHNVERMLHIAVGKL